MSKVDYNRKNYNMCLCGGCPVNRLSECSRAREKELAAQGKFELIEKKEIMPDPKIMPGIYCAVGKSACNDFNGEKNCLCPVCPVAIFNELKNNYYCTKGSAEEIN